MRETTRSLHVRLTQSWRGLQRRGLGTRLLPTAARQSSAERCPCHSTAPAEEPAQPNAHGRSGILVAPHILLRCLCSPTVSEGTFPSVRQLNCGNNEKLAATAATCKCLKAATGEGRVLVEVTAAERGTRGCEGAARLCSRRCPCAPPDQRDVPRGWRAHAGSRGFPAALVLPAALPRANPRARSRVV